MSVTVLIDLDDTLLGNEMGLFLPAYFQTLQDSLSGLITKEIIMPVFLAAVQEMIGAEHIDRPLMNVFYDHFCAETGASREEIQTLADQYYRSAYTRLKEATVTSRGAQEMVGAFAGKGYPLVVATNPLFPRLAIEQRIRWAELPVDLSYFKLITTGEIFHYPKPNPAYYAEILGYLGWPEGALLMVGNDPVNDVQGAGELGIPTFHVTGSQSGGVESISGDNHSSGEIGEVVAWLEGKSESELLPNYRSSKAILAIYKSTISVIDTYVRNCDETLWDLRQGDEWTAREVLFHLKDVEQQVTLPRIKAIVRQDSPFIAGVDTDAWYKNGFPELGEPRAILNELMESRMETIRHLALLDDAGWALPARHAIFGPTDILEIAHIMARHDQLHIRQLSQLLSIK